MTSQSYSDSHSPSGDSVEFTPEDQLLLYGAYKQATKGDVNTLKPAFFDISARSKWQAWANLRGKSKEEASEIYVNLVVKSLTRPASHPEHIMLADEILQRPSTPPPPLPILLQQKLDEKEPEPVQYVTSNSSNISDQHLHLQPTRKGSIALSTGVRSSAPSVYELASESLVDGEVEESTTTIDIQRREFTETVVEEEIIDDDDDDYADEVQKATSSLSPPLSRNEDATCQTREPVHTEQAGDGTNDGEDDEVYQSSEEYDEDDSDESSVTLAPVPSQQIKREVVPHQQVLVNTDLDTAARANRHHSREDDFVDEGVFEEEEKDEHVAQDQGLLGSIEVLDMTGDKEEEKILAKSPISRNGSISSGYGGSVLSDKESTLSYRNTLDMLISDQNKESKIGLTSPHVEPYRVNFMQDASISPLDLNIHKDEHEQSRRNSNQHAADAPTRQDTPAVSSAPQSPVSVSASLVQSSQPSSSASATTAPVDEPVCPVSKKTASSGGVCPAAMFAQARAAAAAAAENGPSPATSTEAKGSTNSHTNNEASSSSSSSPTIIPRSASEPVHAPESESSASSSTPSTVTAAANPGKRLGQGIVNRFTALRSSLAAVSARASALSGGSSSTATVDPNAVVVKDPVTHQSVTVVCPHLKSTRELETEVIRLQTEVSVLHERLDLLQESLKLKSESRKLEQRSVRGVLKMMLRQGLINAALLLIVFAILYKRRSPIAYAILAYIGHSKKEGEASWRAFMRWSADLVRTGQKNQQYVLRAGRRNGYW
ncbi:hypothetical protein BGZ79_006685 [Entomortierella chlamydospora]|nr:hypothetical protein BGZ79_006685 [Entomortierella chlamydospora]